LHRANHNIVAAAREDDPGAMTSVELNYRVDPATNYSAVTIVDDGTSWDAVAGDGIYSATIPGQSINVVVAFYIQAADPSSATSRFPALLNDNSPVRECVVMFGDAIPTGGFGTYHLWLTQTNINRWKSLPDLSNESF